MQQVLIQMALLVGTGLAWRLARPAGLDPADTRRALTSLVYYVLLPALVLEVMWRAPLGLDTVRIALVAASGVLFALTCAWAAYRIGRTHATASGALMLAAAFPNVTYLGLPVLEKTLGSWARSVAIQYDLFACLPLVLTVGVMVARHYGTAAANEESPWIALMKVPAVWAAVAGVALNLSHVTPPAWLTGWLVTLGSGVVPLMLISLGMALTWDHRYWKHLPLLGPVLIIQMMLMPAWVWGAATVLGLSGDMLIATVLEAAMPSMVIGIVLCDRYHLDTVLYAAAVTLTTAVSLFTLPLWFHILQPG